MNTQPPLSAHTDTPLPYTTLYLSAARRGSRRSSSGSLEHNGSSHAFGYAGDGYRLYTDRARAIGRIGVFRRFVLGRGLRSEEHTSELQLLMRISYAVFCLKKKRTPLTTPIIIFTLNR